MEANRKNSRAHVSVIFGFIGCISLVAYHFFAAYFAWQTYGLGWGIAALLTPPVSDVFLWGVMMVKGLWYVSVGILVAGSFLYFGGRLEE